MTSPDDIDRQLEEFGDQWRRRPSLADRVVARLESESPSVLAKSSSWLGGLTMAQRFTFGGIGAAVVAAVIILVATSTSPLTFAQVAENLRQARSYSVKMTMEPIGDAPWAKNGSKLSQTVYWKAPGSYRKEIKHELRDSVRMDQVEISDTEKPGIEIDNLAKTYRIEPAVRGTIPPLAMLEKLGHYRGKSHKQLGAKRIADVDCEGFEIQVKEIDPDAGDGNVTLWVDTETKLPVTVIFRQDQPIPIAMRMEDIQWNLELPDRLFNTTPPKGYANKTPPPDDIKTQVAEITKSLKLYAELSGGHYPKVKIVYGDVTRDAMREMAGFRGLPKPEWYKDKKFQEITAATKGLARINMIQVNNPDAAYHGVDVGPEDANKVLFRWQLDNGDYQLIYGDLRGETVSAQNLRGLE